MAAGRIVSAMAKDTEKLIRQLSLISYLMAERRPVTALEIRRDVEGYSTMNEDAFARRFYADRSELDSLGIVLTVERPVDGVAEQENYSLRPENFHLPAIAFTDGELAALQTALSLLDGEFAYAEPLRLALQQISWGRQNPLRAPEQRGVGLGITASAGGHDLSQRLAKIETAIFRNKTITFDYYTMARDATGTRKVDPYHLLFQGGQFYLLGHAHERGALRVFRLSRIQGKVAYATKSEHDFKGRPEGFDPRAYANRAVWQFGEAGETAEIRISERIAWQIERHFGRFGEVRPAGPEHAGDIVFSTKYADRRQLAAWVLRLGEHARVLGPPELEQEVADRVELLYERHRDGGDGRPAFDLAPDAAPRHPEPAAASSNGNARRTEAAIRPERIARLVTLASILIQAGRAEQRLQAADVCELMQISDAELREDINVLNVVNFGGGSYVLYAEIGDGGEIEVDPEPYSDNFARPARLLARRGEGARRRDRPHRRAPARGLARVVARRRSSTRSARTRWSRACTSRTTAATTPASRASPRRRSWSAACCGWTTTSPTRTSSPSASSSRTRSSTAARDGMSPATTPIAATCATSAWTASATRRSPTGRSSRAPRSTPLRRSTAGCARARSRPRGSPGCGFRPSARAGRARSAASCGSSPTARSSSS